VIFLLGRSRREQEVTSAFLRKTRQNGSRTHQETMIVGEMANCHEEWESRRIRGGWSKIYDDIERGVVKKGNCEEPVFLCKRD